MNKSNLIAAVAEGTGITRSEAARAVGATFEVIADALKDGADVRVIGFGNFGVADRAARVDRNPRTGEPVEIAVSLPFIPSALTTEGSYRSRPYAYA